MLRIVSLLLLTCLFVPVADARTPLRLCRKACRPLVSEACPQKRRALAKCRQVLLRDCRRQGVAVCALGMPTGTPGDGSPTTTSPGDDGFSPPTTTLPVVTTTVPSSPVTTTTLPSAAHDVSGSWDFTGAIVQRGCGFDASYDTIESSLVVSQQGSVLSGSTEGAPASGQVSAGGWTFVTQPDCRQVPGSTATCCLTFSIDVDGFGSPATAQGTATAQCQGSMCQAHWTGSVTRGD